MVPSNAVRDAYFVDPVVRLKRPLYLGLGLDVGHELISRIKEDINIWDLGAERRGLP